MNEKILIVEDNPLDMRLIEMVLRAKSYTLLRATNGAEAVDVVMREHPDIIILDTQLPDVSGLEVARRLKETLAFSPIPVIAVTAHAMKGDKERIIEAGCDAYLSKPIDTRELPRKVVEMLLRRPKNRAEPTSPQIYYA